MRQGIVRRGKVRPMPHGVRSLYTNLDPDAKTRYPVAHEKYETIWSTCRGVAGSAYDWRALRMEHYQHRLD